MSDDPIIDQFEKMGPAGVRLWMSSGRLPTAYHQKAIEWLAQKDQEERSLNEASQEEQIEIARSAKDAAWVAARAAERAASAAERANTRATIARAIGMISIIGSIIGILVTHYDALHK